MFQSDMIECDSCLSDNEDIGYWPFEHRSLSHITDFIDVDLNNLMGISEILVPTCSYRMGEPNMGYGVAIIGKKAFNINIIH